ncbi:hypothetical protein DWW90_16920, partial [Parabacteroides sp. AF17-28]
LSKNNYFLLSPQLFGVSRQKRACCRGAYCIKRIFQPQKTSETKQMLIHFFDLKKGLFLLFRAFSAITTVLISITTVLIGSALGTSRRL